VINNIRWRRGALWSWRRLQTV